MINSVTIAGNTTRDVEVRRTQSGAVVASFGIAVNERKKNQATGEWGAVPHYFDVTAFGDRWEKLAAYIPKGTKLTVQGRLRYSSWEKDGSSRSKVDIVADEVELPPRSQGQSGSPGYQQPVSYGAYAPADIPF